MLILHEHSGPRSVSDLLICMHSWNCKFSVVQENDNSPGMCTDPAFHMACMSVVFVIVTTKPKLAEKMLFIQIALTHLAPDQPLPFRYEIPCEGK